MRRVAAMVMGISMLLCGCRQEAPAASDKVAALTDREENSEFSVDYAARRVQAGSVRTALGNGAQGQVRWEDPYMGAGGDHTDPAVYTFREYLSAAAGLNWAPHTWQTAADRYILDYTTMGFYDMVLRSDGEGFCFVCEMAAQKPEDVTEAFTGRFGIAQGDSARAWKIALNPDACWENGEKIDADTYLYSYQQLLDGRMHNRRADTLYAGEFSIVGAKEYLYGQWGWEQVGIVKTGQYELVLVTTAPIADPDFYVPYYLTATYLVYEPLWEQCKTCFDENGKQVAPDSENIATISTNYCTSLDTSIGYGPYRLAYFELDKQITLERNENWYGYGDGRHTGQYQTDRIDCQVIANPATALLAFLGGALDSISLRSEDMERYAASPRVRYSPESYTTKLSFNTDKASLSQRGCQILASPYFRKALALAIDRTRFAAGYTSAGVPGYGLLNTMYIYDPYTGQAYRDSAGAKNALVQLYGLDTDAFGGLDRAHEAITGYDPALARQLMQRAWEEAVESGDYDGVSPITLQLAVYQSQDIYVQMYHFLQDALALACKGTDLEGRVTLEMAVDADYYAAMESGLTDMIFSTWGGSSYDPYGVLYRCYCDWGLSESPNQNEYGFDAAAVTVQMNIDGNSVSDSLQSWARWCSGDQAVTIGTLLPFRSYDAATRCAIYAGLEYAYLSQFVTTPLYYRNAATLLSYKGDYPSASYVDPVGFGGIRFYAYHYDDAAWDAVKGNFSY